MERASLPAIHLTYETIGEPLGEVAEDRVLELPSPPASEPNSEVHSPSSVRLPSPTSQDNTGGSIDNNDSYEKAAAAITIQRVFRAHRERRRASSESTPTANEGSLLVKPRGSYTPAEPSAPPFSPNPGNEAAAEKENEDMVDGQPSPSGRQSPTPLSRSSAASSQGAHVDGDSSEQENDYENAGEQENDANEVYEDAAAEFSPEEQQLLSALLPAASDGEEEREKEDI